MRFQVSFKRFSVRDFLERRWKRVPGCRAGKGETSFAEFELESWQLIAMTVGRSQPAATWQVGCCVDHVRQVDGTVPIMYRVHDDAEFKCNAVANPQPMQSL